MDARTRIHKEKPQYLAIFFKGNQRDIKNLNFLNFSLYTYQT